MTRKLNLVLVSMLLLVLALSACGGGDDQPADTATPAVQPTEAPQGHADEGEKLYSMSCAGCHGPNGEGVTGLGKPFADSEFIQNTSDDDLLDLLKKGRPISDPANTTGVDMPPKGGNPALSDDDLRDIIAFLHTLGNQ